MDKKSGNGQAAVLTHRCVLISMAIFITVILFNFVALGQESRSGTILGSLIDSETAGAIIGASVMLEGTRLGAATDLNGQYIIKRIPPGIYNLVISSIGYEQTRVEAISVNPGESSQFDLILQPRAQSLMGKKIVVKAKAVQNTEASLLKYRQLSNTVSDAISAEAILRAGSGDAAAAVTRVIGASVVGGKYIYVRGLGERYSNTRLNGTILPTPDPDKQAVQMDLFPTSLLDNIMVEKTFSPDKPGNFTGGSINMTVKDMPEAMTMTFSSSAAYNSNTTFNRNFISQPGGGTNWLGIEDGGRNIPEQLFNSLNNIPSIAEGFSNKDKALEIDQLAKSFNSDMAPVQRRAPLNQSYSFSLGNSYTVLGRTLGLLGSLSYSHNYSFYENGQVARWGLSQGAADSLANDYMLSETRGKDEVLWGGLANMKYAFGANHRMGLYYMYNRNAESDNRYLVGSVPKDFPHDGGDVFVYETRAMQYIERSLGSIQLNGDHFFKPFRMDWKLSRSVAEQDEPDQRFFSNHYAVVQDGDSLIYGYQIARNLYPQPMRIFRNLEEEDRQGELNISFPLKPWSGLGGKIKLGLSHLLKERKVSEYRFSVDNPTGLIRYSGEVEEYLSDDNMGILENRSDTLPDTIDGDGYSYYFGNVITDASSEGNNYSGKQKVFATYSMIDLTLAGHLNLVTGIRYESTDMTTFSKSNTYQPGEIIGHDWLPSAAMTYRFMENMNLRAVYGRTLARPTLREMSSLESFEFIKGYILVGNPNLRHTLIDNYDLRWEWFTQPGQILAASAFYKRFKDPIERAIVNDNGYIQYINVDRANVSGLELEARFGLGGVRKFLRNFKVEGNLTLVRSQVKLGESELAIRKSFDSTASDSRPLQGQSPYIINLNIAFDSERSGTHVTLLYNVFGSRISDVSMGGVPDVYEQPRQMIDATLSQLILTNLTLKISAKNLLNASIRKTHEYKGNEYVFQENSTGRIFSIGLSAKIF